VVARQWTVVSALFALGACPGAYAANLTSRLGSTGPAFETGMTPSKLGWGADDQPYPDRIVVNTPDLAEMVWVPAGRFRMGSTREELDRQWTENGWDPTWKDFAKDEQPQHQVRIAGGFWLAKQEVTIGQYQRFLDATGGEAPPFWSDLSGHERLPAILLTWHDSEEYSRWAGGSLPTEAQWEWSARGPAGRLYPWGDTWDRTRCNSAEYWAGKALPDAASWKAWTDTLAAGIGTAVLHLREVGGYTEGAGWTGALDQAGNVCEWCSDWYGEGYYGQSLPADPDGLTIGTYRVLRGGSWRSVADLCRTTNRGNLDPDERYFAYGLRVAWAVER
jgi:formylglycine-generating enzyme